MNWQSIQFCEALIIGLSCVILALYSLLEGQRTVQNVCHAILHQFLPPPLSQAITDLRLLPLN